MANPSIPSSIFGPGPSAVGASSSLIPFAADNPPASGSSNNTYIMPSSPMKKAATDGYRPKVTRTLGQRPACLVNASVTYCGNNQMYAFGGFDQYTDEVYNHVLKLDLIKHEWSLVDNYGDIPGVRMGRHLEAKLFPIRANLTDCLISRPHSNALPRRQTPGVWRRERAPYLPIRPHHIRPQDCQLDTADSVWAHTKRPSETRSTSPRR